jgi:outer membrane protein OmpA-like peptidoglycan-associated protein
MKMHIHLPKPCHENWSEMTVTEQGKFCNACQKEVVDFTILSDIEILGIIKQKPFSICGRFKENQLDKELISPLVHKKPNKTYLKWLMSLLSFISVKQVYSKSITPPYTQEQGFGKFRTNEIVISGIVKDESGKVVQEAYVQIADTTIRTSIDGTFSYTLAGNEPNEFKIIIYDNNQTVEVVRTYHKAMKSIYLDVTLKPSYNGYIHSYGGAVYPRISLEFKPILFNTKSLTISKENKMMLDSIALDLKGNPDVSIRLTHTIHNNEYKMLAQKRNEKIKSYLVDKKGIREERILTTIEYKKSETNNNFVIISAE